MRCRILFWSIFDCVVCLALLNVDRNNKYSTDKYHFSVPKTLSWLLFILTFKYDTPHAVKGDKSYDCHFASHNLDRFRNWCKTEVESANQITSDFDRNVTLTISHALIVLTPYFGEKYVTGNLFSLFFPDIACVAEACFFLGRKEKYLAVCKKKLRRLLSRLCLSTTTNMARGLKNVCELISDIAILGLEKSLAVAV